MNPPRVGQLGAARGSSGQLGAARGSSGQLGAARGSSGQLGRGESALALATCAALILLAYGDLLEAWFHPIDDALHLVGVTEGKYPIAHWRPRHFAWNRTLFACFGTDAFAWHAAGLVLHAASACLLFSLLRRVGVGIAGALAGSCVFAVLHAPLAAVAWISAASGPLVVFFVLLSGVCWQRYLGSERSKARAAWYVAALLALVCAAASKEDCVLAGPLLFGLHVVRDGWRTVLRPRGLLRYAPFALFGAVYLAFVFDPAVWADRPGVGQYSFRFEMVPKAVTNLVVLFWPRHMTIGAAPRWMLFVGIAFLLVIVGAARDGRERWQRVLYLGLAVALFGLLPVLPGPWESVAASRLGYPSAIGAGMIVAAVAEGALARPSRSLRVAALCAIAAGCVVSALSVRSTISWRFVDASRNYRALIDATLVRLDASESGSVIFVAPPVWSALDHERGALAFANGRRIDSERLELPLEEIDARLGALSSRAEVVVWEDGRWASADASTIDHEMLRRAADANATHGHTDSVPANWLRRP